MMVHIQVIVVALLTAAGSTVCAQQVQTGADVLLRDSLHVITEKRIGLVTNHTSILADATLLYDRLLQHDNIRITALFSPEHGFTGTASAGEAIPSGMIDGIPLYSLYGSVRKPTAAMLEGLDALLFDMQDIGARYYTYISTLALCIEAAAENGIEVIVLDRPNPIGGEVMEGPIRQGDMSSFVAALPIPVRHGMTVGELALMMVGEGWIGGADNAALRVIPMRGWRRAMMFEDTDLPWRSPSPNIVSVDAALAYVGTCLLEGSAVSEGRGTDAPFLLFGAPWLDSDAVVHALAEQKLPGVRFRKTTFTPKENKGAKNPQYAGTRCEGVALDIIDRGVFRPFDCGMRILAVIHDIHAGKTGFTSYLETLVGIRGFARRCLRSRVAAMNCEWSDDLRTFMEQRSAYLLYQ
jgi:uncharacterized protein YbbC (DUF1343 family)